MLSIDNCERVPVSLLRTPHSRPHQKTQYRGGSAYTFVSPPPLHQPPPRMVLMLAIQVHDPSWKNQDAGLVIAPLDRREGQALFAIFDGERVRRRGPKQLHSSHLSVLLYLEGKRKYICCRSLDLEAFISGGEDCTRARIKNCPFNVLEPLHLCVELIFPHNGVDSAMFCTQSTPVLPSLTTRCI